MGCFSTFLGVLGSVELTGECDNWKTLKEASFALIHLIDLNHRRSADWRKLFEEMVDSIVTTAHIWAASMSIISRPASIKRQLTKGNLSQMIRAIYIQGPKTLNKATQIYQQTI